MQKLLPFLFCFFICSKIFSQGNLPSITATSTSVDIRVGNEYFAKGGWILEADKKPDIFSIGSKWNYDTKRVTFITNIDSITFNVKPGRTYDFIILLNGKTPCYTRIITLANPVFLKANILVCLFIGFAIIMMIWYVNRKKIQTKSLLQLGYLAVTGFWLMTFISGYIHGHYNHLKNTISELGAIGTTSELFTSSSLVLISLVATLFSIGFYRASKEKQLSVVPAILSFAMPVTLLWAGIFTLGNEFHTLTGPLPFLIIFGSLFAYILWKKDRTLLQVRILSLFSFFIMTLILLRFITPFGNEYEGLVQRFFYLGWTFWTISITYFFSKTKK